jgi:hypothetical protein
MMENTRNEKKVAHLGANYNVHNTFVSETGGIKTGP